jgi:hypothetical protein
MVLTAAPEFTTEPMATVPSWQLRQSLESPSGGFCGVDFMVDDDGRVYVAVVDSEWFQSGT